MKNLLSIYSIVRVIKHKTKHIALRYNFIREQISDNHIVIEYLPTQDMTSDILTKALGPTAFLHLRPKLLGM